MNIGPCTQGKTFKEVVHQSRLQVPDHPRAHLGIHHSGSAAAKIYGGYSHGLVHRHQKIPGSQDSAFTAQGLIERLPEHDADILHRVMLIDVEIAVRLQLQIEASMMRE